MSKNNLHLLGNESLAEKMRKVKQQIEESKEIEINAELQQNIEVGESTKQNVSEVINKSKVLKKKVPPKLFVSGRLDRKKHEYIARSLVLLNSIEEDIKAYCRGGDLVILNYLIREGLNKVKDSEFPISVDMADIETLDIM